MKSRAAVAWEAGQPLSVEEVDIAGPRDGEVLVRLVATGVCHTDAYTLSGEDPEGAFPAILGHEGGGIVEEVGAGISSVQVGESLSGDTRYTRAGRHAGRYDAILGEWQRHPAFHGYVYVLGIHGAA